MSDILLKSYKIEYEQTPITLPKLRKKYSLTADDTRGWRKQLVRTSQPDIITVMPPPTEIEPTTDNTHIVIGEMEESILKAKKLAIARVVSYFDGLDPTAEIEVKEFKDMTGVLTSLGDSIKRKEENGPTVNILVQNLMKRLVDDC